MVTQWADITYCASTPFLAHGHNLVIHLQGCFLLNYPLSIEVHCEVQPINSQGVRGADVLQ
jgi:hypothetical protein